MAADKQRQEAAEGASLVMCRDVPSRILLKWA
jgi:hypothetical protein